MHAIHTIWAQKTISIIKEETLAENVYVLAWLLAHLLKCVLVQRESSIYTKALAQNLYFRLSEIRFTYRA